MLIITVLVSAIFLAGCAKNLSGSAIAITDKEGNVLFYTEGKKLEGRMLVVEVEEMPKVFNTPIKDVVLRSNEDGKPIAGQAMAAGISPMTTRMSITGLCDKCQMCCDPLASKDNCGKRGCCVKFC